MEYFDLHLTSSQMKEKIKIAERLDMKALGFTVSSNGNVESFLKEVETLETGLDIVKCILIEADGPKQMKNLVSKYREKFEIVSVFGGDYAINRAACENSRVDILLRPEFRRKDSGMDDKIAKAAAENDVAIGISIHSILTTYKKIRAQILAHHSKNLMICDNFNVPVVFVSGAISKWELRDMRDIAGLANILGYPINKAIESVTEIPERIVTKNRKKLTGKIVNEGVEVG